MALAAVIFDLDGTLIDTNAAHVDAWDAALKHHGYKVSPDRIAVEIGKGGDKLIPSILGEQIEKQHGESLRKTHDDEFSKIAQAQHLKPFPDVEPLLRAIKSRGLKTALATSSKMDGVKLTLKSARVDWLPLFNAVATGDDSSESKPHPGIVNAALKKLDLSPAQCAMVGDTPYDSDSARDAGIVCLGVTCGGMNDEKKLRQTGMRKVYSNPGDILDHLDEFLRIASPGPLALTRDRMEFLMREALKIAREALHHNEVPIGCVIAAGDGAIIARAHNELNGSRNKTAHAEIVAFSRAAGRVSTDAHDLILVSTLEPCVMCLGAAMEAAVDTILFALAAPCDGGRARVRPPTSPESQMPRIIGDILAPESTVLLEEFLRQDAVNPAQARFVQQLLNHHGSPPTNS